MNLHNLFGRHVPDCNANRWDDGVFVSRCEICQKPMEKLPGLGWRIRASAR